MESICVARYNAHMAARYMMWQIMIWITDFIEHWYINGFRFFVTTLIKGLTHYDRTLALRINIKNIFNPMYQDRSIIGYFFGFIFRFIRIVLALSFYAVLGLFFIMIYVLWALLPLYLIIQIINTNAFSIF